MPNPTAAMLVIGDEILSGRTRDSNMHFLAGELTRIGIDLKEVRVVSDDRAAIVSALNALSAAFDTVFTSGGIGRRMTISPPIAWRRPSAWALTCAMMPVPSSRRITTAQGPS